MLRRTIVPLALLAIVFGAFGAGAWALAAGNDLGGFYFVALALVALRFEMRLVTAGTP